MRPIFYVPTLDSWDGAIGDWKLETLDLIT